jgi:catechol 2,3-dioxygenase-like lactoylglutathione lyase family enzyme
VFTYVCLGASDPPRAAPFFDALMGALGHRRCRVPDEWAAQGWYGWGVYTGDGERELALWVCPAFDGRPVTAGNGTMVALAASSWEQVEAFHAAALAHGGRSEGPPGLRAHYGADFYAAYVRDPDGNKLAAVCRGFTQRSAAEAPSGQ